MEFAHCMRQYFSDWSDEQYTAFVEMRRKEQYLAGWQWPISWFHCAWRHKLAADLLYDAAKAAHKRDMARLLADIDKPVEERRKSGPVEGQELLDMRLQDLLAEFLLLSGYALECLLKGLLMARNPEIANDKKLIKARIATHDICKLSDDCGVTLTKDERELLELIGRHIAWGKYPASIHLEDTPSWIDPDDQKNKSLAVSNPYHEDRLKRIVDSVYQRIHDLLSSTKTY